MTARKYWILFAVTQIVGLTLPQFGNVHLDPFPFLLILLLIPGLFVSFVPHIPDIAGDILIVAINVVTWHLVRKILRRGSRNSSVAGPTTSKL